MKKFNVNQFSILSEALFFIAEGGYVGKYNSSVSENIRLEKIEKKQRANQRTVTFLTVILAVSALIEAVFVCVQLYWKYHWFRPR